MIIFEHNNFARDTHNLRTSRLLALKTYINDFIATLSIPQAMVDWALAAHNLWSAALTKTHLETGESSEAYQTMHEADEACFDYYIRCKGLVLDRYEGEDNKLKIYGVEGAFPKDRKARLRAVKDLLFGNERLTTEGDPNVLPPAFITNLQTLYNASNDTFANLVLKEKEEALDAVDDQNALFDADSKQLRALYSWTLMTWTYYEPKLILLGFAPRVERHGGGQPDAPTNLVYDEPTETFSWDAVTGATSYQLSYIKIENGNEVGQWQEAYSGADTSVVFTPAAGEWKFKVRARDAQGYGAWSNVVIVNNTPQATIVMATKQNPASTVDIGIKGADGKNVHSNFGDGNESDTTVNSTNYTTISNTYINIGNYSIQLIAVMAAFWGIAAINALLSAINLPDSINPFELDFSNNLLTSFHLPNTFTNIIRLVLTNNELDQQSINLILTTIDDFGTSNGYIDLSGGNNAAPSGQGIAAMNQLIAKGWTVTTN